MKSWTTCLVIIGVLAVPGDHVEARTPASGSRISPVEASAAWPEWAFQARMAGASFELEMTTAEIEAKLSRLEEEGVSVVIADAPTGWSYTAWTRDDEFNEVLSMMRDRVIPRAHAHNLHLVWYLTSLELICSECAATGFDPGQEHPDWLQIDCHGQPVEFSGVEGVFWLERDDYDLWLSPESPYGDFYRGRIRELATSGADGLWMDVAYLLNGLGQFEDLWPSTDAFSRTAFERAYGESIPEKNWESLPWRHWIRWREESIAAFVRSVAEAAHSVDPDLLFFTENWCMDSNFVAQYAQDPLDFSAASGVATAHELEPVDQDDRGMQDAGLEDWQDYALLVRFAVVSNGGRPAWVLSYAGAVSDSLREAAVHMAEGANFYEARGPEMLDDSTGSRPQVFAWIAGNAGAAYSSGSMADIALYFSPRSRDFIDGEESGDDKFDEGETIYYRHYREVSRRLLSAQQQFDIVGGFSSAEDLKAYEWLVIPGAACLSDAEITAIRNFEAAGGKLAMDGDTGSRDEWCLPRDSNPLEDLGNHDMTEVSSSLLRTNLTADEMSRVLINAREGEDADGPYLALFFAGMLGDAVENLGIDLRLPPAFEVESLNWNAIGNPGGGLESSIDSGRLHFTLPRLESGAVVLIRGKQAPEPRGPRQPTGRAG